MASEKSIKKNYIYNLIYQVLTFITPFITAPYVSRILEPDGVGTFSYIQSINSYFVLFATFGIATYGQREISYYQDNLSLRSQAFWNTKVLEIITSGICFFTYVAFSINTAMPVLYLVMSFNILAVVCDATWFFQGMEEFGKIVFRNILLKILNIVYIFTVVTAKDDLVWYAAGCALFPLLANIVLWGYLPKYITGFHLSELRPFKNFQIVLSLFVPSIAIQVYTVLDKTMIGVITQSAFENGYYDRAIILSKIGLSVVGSLGTVMIPRIGFLYSHRDYGKIRYYIAQSFRFVWMVTIPMSLGLFVIIENFVPWFFGPGYEEVIPIVRILAALLFIIGISNVIGLQYLIPTNRQNLFTKTVLAGAVFNFCMNMVLIPIYAARGAAIASVLAELIISLLELYMVRKEIPIGEIFRAMVNYLLAGSAMFVLLINAERVLSASFLHTIILILSGMLTYALVLILLRDVFFVGNLKRMAGFLCEKLHGGR